MDRGDLLQVADREESKQVAILIADDDPEIRLLLRRILEPESLFDIVGEARDGAEAIKLTRTLSPDVIVLDLAMPRMDGLRAIPRLRRLAPDSRIIVLSGFAPFFDSEEKARELGVDEVLSKSTRPRRLRRAILRGRSSRRGPDGSDGVQPG